ncbi:hypothetical protein [Lysinibacillus sp. NPDC059133]|uniref:hypothetical protein n=1 Tax=Lysinibacillus sp. NPDC059133 TaxID=3346737 RepID=UPI0036B4E6A1
MKPSSSIGKFIYWIGFLCISGLETSLGTFDYSSLIPNKSVALLYIFIGIALMLSSNFIKSRIDQ